MTVKPTILAAIFCALFLAPAYAEEMNARIYSVTDGDTIKFEARLLNTRIKDECRMLHYNAPEIHGKEKPLGKQATLKMRELVENKDVRIKADKRDKYGRLLCEVYLMDGTDINAFMRRWLTEVLKYSGVGKYDWMESSKPYITKEITTSLANTPQGPL